jgi:type I restriction enzyme S subunit
LDLLENYPSYLPPLELQDRFSKVVRRSDALVDRQKVQLQELDALFASLQHRAFNGEL